MTLRQLFLKLAYPLLMKVTGAKKESIKNNVQQKQPGTPFYDLQSILIDGKALHFDELKGKKVLLVNTASDCGYTNQYNDLEKLHKKFKDTLVILGFPANDFKEQEKGSDNEIAAFCKKNFGVSFLLMKKSSVIKGTEQNNVFNWLSDSLKNGWNDKAPEWNFSKYLVDEQGVLTHYFAPGVSPLSKKVLKVVKN
ncbi:MAG: glutathione peroxidase [Chitinophagaceae bacterium]|nr:glutathione peroxidase [Chitinophagaceae bacterium]